jgi:DNA-directed RNA polymerase specialized sigma24 family protein
LATTPDIDSHVKNATARHAHQFVLREWARLEVKAAYRARPRRQRMVFLNEIMQEAVGFRIHPVDRFPKEIPLGP